MKHVRALVLWIFTEICTSSRHPCDLNLLEMVKIMQIDSKTAEVMTSVTLTFDLER